MIEISFENIGFEEGIYFKRIQDNISLVVSGHSNYDKKGKDIVCSAVSVLSQTLVLSISKICRIDQALKNEPGLLKTEFSILNLTETQLASLKNIFDYYIIGLFELVKSYPGYIEIRGIETLIKTE